MQTLDLYDEILVRIEKLLYNFIKGKTKRQAGAELCQAQDQFGLAWFGLGIGIGLHTKGVGGPKWPT